MRALERLYFKADGTTLVRESDEGAVTLYCKRGDEISAADMVTYRDYFVAFGWITMSVEASAEVQIKSVHVKHDDDTGSASIVIPPRSIIQDVFVVCTENAAGGPDIDFGEYGEGDSDGILDGIGTTGVCDTTTASIDTSENFRGRGVLIAGFDENGLRVKRRKFYPNGVTLANTKNAAGTAGEWEITIMYILLPEVVNA